MDFSTSVKTCFNKFTKFEGRASRSEYWWFILFCWLIDVVLGAIPYVGWTAWVVITIGLLIPKTAVAYRRIQDTGKPGWLAFLFLGLDIFLFLGSLLEYIFCLFESEPTENQYGPVPEE